MADADTTPVRSILGAAGLGLIGLLAGLVVAVLFGELIMAMVPSVRDSLPARNAVTTVGQGIGLVAVAMFYLHANDLPWSYVRIDRPTGRQLLITAGVVAGLFAVLVVTLELLELVGVSVTEHSIAETARANPEILLPLIPISILVTGPAEELLYRGVIQTRLTEAFDVGIAIAVASAIFALVHVPAYMAGGGLDVGLIASIAILLLLGAFLGIVYEYTGNLLVPMIAHGVYNAITYGSSYVMFT